MLPVDPSPLTDNVSAQVEIMKKWKAEGGGTDEPEDQLAGIKAALAMNWRKNGWLGARVTKIILVVTDAAAHNPDRDGNTIESIAKTALDLDPVHIYPIIIGSGPQALADGKKIAESTGATITGRPGSPSATILLWQARSRGFPLFGFSH